MKKALVGFLILAVSTGVFAQEEKEQGLKFSGALKTGIQFQTSNEKNVATDSEKYDPSIRMYNDDAGEETRFDLDGTFTKDNYGVVFRLRTDTVISGPNIGVHQAYVWADFLNQIINVKVGSIDDSAWNSDGDEDFEYSTGTGLRLEVKPIEGLNVGLFLNAPKDAKTDYYNRSEEKYGIFWEDFEFFFDDDEETYAIPAGTLAEHFFLETAFGAKYESDAFYVAGGLRIDGKADGLATGDFYRWTTNDNLIAYGTGAHADQGLGAYVGFGVSAVPNLTAKVEAQFNNLTGYADYGWIWVNETFGYAITEQLEAGLVMHQYLFGGDNKFVEIKIEEEVLRLKDDASVSPYLTFKPYVSYALNDQWTVGLDVPLTFWPDIVDYDIGVKPNVSYKLGENASINAFYLFDLEQPGKLGYDGDTPDSIIKNTVQIDFIWTF
jgi:hypothetical protein